MCTFYMLDHVGVTKVSSQLFAGHFHATDSFLSCSAWCKMPKVIPKFSELVMRDLHYTGLRRLGFASRFSYRLTTLWVYLSAFQATDRGSFRVFLFPGFRLSVAWQIQRNVGSAGCI